MDLRHILTILYHQYVLSALFNLQKMMMVCTVINFCMIFVKLMQNDDLESLPELNKIWLNLWEQVSFIIHSDKLISSISLTISSVWFHPFNQLVCTDHLQFVWCSLNSFLLLLVWIYDLFIGHWEIRQKEVQDTALYAIIKNSIF